MNDFRSWQATALAQVRFKPDRESIAQELTAHYEDHVQDLERLEYPTELARQRALDAMGDPEIVGKALDRVHQPWLGWLWMVSQVAVTVCLALVLVYATGYWQNVAEDLRFPEKPDEMDEYEPDGFHYDPTAAWTREAVTAGGSVDRCGYHISVPYAALWGDGNDGPYYAASILLTVEDGRFWDGGPAPALRQMSAVDDKGGQYTSSMEYFDYPVEERRARWGSHIQVGPQEKTPFYETYWVTIYFRDGFRPQWLELTCESGEGFTFRLEWEDGK
jgi:hypothetical protein